MLNEPVVLSHRIRHSMEIGCYRILLFYYNNSFDRTTNTPSQEGASRRSKAGLGFHTVPTRSPHHTPLHACKGTIGLIWQQAEQG